MSHEADQVWSAPPRTRAAQVPERWAVERDTWGWRVRKAAKLVFVVAPALVLVTPIATLYDGIWGDVLRLLPVGGIGPGDNTRLMISGIGGGLAKQHAGWPIIVTVSGGRATMMPGVKRVVLPLDQLTMRSATYLGRGSCRYRRDIGSPWALSVSGPTIRWRIGVPWAQLAELAAISGWSEPPQGVDEHSAQTWRQPRSRWTPIGRASRLAR